MNSLNLYIYHYRGARTHLARLYFRGVRTHLTGLYFRGVRTHLARLYLPRHAGQFS